METKKGFTGLISSSFHGILESMGITEPTPIQEKSIPLIKQGKDVFCQSSTGSGKTLAFALPISEMIKVSAGLQVLVLVPTRELCEQVAEEFKKVSKHRNINVVEVYGGVSIGNQISKIPYAHIVVATPGRLCDILNRGVINFSKITNVILDEADRMLDMGFIRDVEFILKAVPKKRQTLMFSATLPKEIEHIIYRHMINPQTVKTKEHVDKNLLKQYYFVVPSGQRFGLLCKLLREEKAPYAIVFCGTRRAVDSVAFNLNNNGISARAIHGGLTQTMRKSVMSSFNEKETNILVASDIAARGLDIKMLKHVYNYDVPKTAGEYTHRIGRTARAGEEGIAMTLVSEKDYDSFRRIQRDRTIEITELDLPENIPNVNFSSHRSHKEHSGRRFAGGQGRRFGGAQQGHRRFGNRQGFSRRRR